MSNENTNTTEDVGTLEEPNIEEMVVVGDAVAEPEFSVEVIDEAAVAAADDLARMNQEDADALFDVTVRARELKERLDGYDKTVLGVAGLQALEAQQELLRTLFGDDL